MSEAFLWNLSHQMTTEPNPAETVRAFGLAMDRSSNSVLVATGGGGAGYRADSWHRKQPLVPGPERRHSEMPAEQWRRPVSYVEANIFSDVTPVTWEDRLTWREWVLDRGVIYIRTSIWGDGIAEIRDGRIVVAVNAPKDQKLAAVTEAINAAQARDIEDGAWAHTKLGLPDEPDLRRWPRGVRPLQATHRNDGHLAAHDGNSVWVWHRDTGEQVAHLPNLLARYQAYERVRLVDVMPFLADGALWVSVAAYGVGETIRVGESGAELPPVEPPIVVTPPDPTPEPDPTPDPDPDPEPQPQPTGPTDRCGVALEILRQARGMALTELEAKGGGATIAAWVAALRPAALIERIAEHEREIEKLRGLIAHAADEKERLEKAVEAQKRQWYDLLALITRVTGWRLPEIVSVPTYSGIAWIDPAYPDKKYASEDEAREAIARNWRHENPKRPETWSEWWALRPSGNTRRRGARRHG